MVDFPNMRFVSLLNTTLKKMNPNMLHAARIKYDSAAIPPLVENMKYMKKMTEKAIPSIDVIFIFLLSFSHDFLNAAMEV